LSTHARAPRVVDNPLPTHATCAAPLRCHRGLRAPVAPPLFSLSLQSPTGRRRETCTSHSLYLINGPQERNVHEPAREHVQDPRQLHILSC